MAIFGGDWLVRHSPVTPRWPPAHGDDVGSREGPRIVKLKDRNGATRSHRLQNAVALASLAWTMEHRVMASDGDCAVRSVTRNHFVPPFWPKKPRTRGGSDVVPLSWRPPGCYGTMSDKRVAAQKQTQQRQELIQFH